MDRNSELSAEGLRAGRLSAFEALYRAEAGRMKSIAYNLLGNRQDAEDAVQETFLKIYRGRQGFRGGSTVTTWTYRILVNTCRDLGRRRQRLPAVVDDSEAALRVSGTKNAEAPLRVALEQALESLGERQRMAFLLYEVEGFPHAEIAAILETTEVNSRSLLFEARRRLQALLTDSKGALKNA